MRIMFATSEASPFLKTGGLGDVAYALPAQLSKLDDNEVAVVMPYYKRIKSNPEFKTQYVTHFYTTLAWRSCYVGIFKAQIKTRTYGKNKGVNLTYYFIDNEYYFGRDEIYGCADDGERFAFFSKALLESILHINFPPDVIHCNDWQTGFVPLFLNAHFRNVSQLSQTRTVFTIHNIEYQGKADLNFIDIVLGIPDEYRGAVIFDGLVNAMKSAIVLADKVTTVSKTYSYEIRYPYFSHGLDNILKENEYKICGIVNGIDDKLYSAEKDEKIFKNFKPGDLKGKAENKKFLQQRLGLPQRDDVPLIGMVTRLVEHKGLDLIEPVIHDILNRDVQIVVLGSGDNKYEDLFKYLSYAYQEKFSATIGFDGALANQIYAGCDFFLMPSKSEPCGLSQLIAMRYGTIPIVRETGGLFDTVPALNTETLEGRGFTFKLFNANDMKYAVDRAVDFYYDKDKLKATVSKLMKEDFSWKNPACEYMNLYNEITG